jgi:hypothetical protein
MAPQMVCGASRQGRVMQDFDIKPGWQRRATAIVIVVVSILNAWRGPESSRLMACVGLIFAYDLAFIPSPPFNVTLREVYARARAGWRMPWISKLLSAAAIILMVTSFYLLLHGR